MSLIFKNDKFIIEYTGEYFDTEELKNAAQKPIEEEIKKVTAVLESIGETCDFAKKPKKKSKKDSPIIVIDNGDLFNKRFRSKLFEDLILENKLSKHALVFIATFEGFICFPKNYVVINEKIPSIPEYVKISKINKKTLYETLNELERFDIIKRNREGKSSVVYFNPYIICAGYGVSQETFLLFRESIYR